jgi:uncharacterized membrane protein YhhN
MINLFIVAAIISAGLAIAADSREPRHASFYLLKPLTTLLILGIALSHPAATAEYQKWVAAALLLSTLGDICLMFKGNGWFMGGLGSFLLAHLLFIAAFVQGLDVIQPPAWAYLVIPCGLALLWILLPRAGALKLPVLVYCSVIVTMVLAACARYAGIGTDSALYAMLGAGVFLISDSALAVRQFVRPYAGAQAVILSTYWLAVGLIAYSV